MTGSVFSRYIACSKIIVTPEQSEQVQKILFEIGFQWIGGIQNPINLSDKFLFITYDFFTDRYLFLSTNNEEIFYGKNQYKIMTFKEFIDLAKKVKKLNKIICNF